MTNFNLPKMLGLYSKNNKTIFMLATLLILTLVAARSEAALIVDISDNGAGLAQFNLSGSATIVSGTENDNEIWLRINNWSSYPINALSFSVINSGSFSITTTANGTLAGTEFYHGVSDGLGFRVESGFNLDAGDVVSWIGEFVVDRNFSDFAMSSFNSPFLGYFGDNATLDANTIVRTNTSPVSEPAIIALFGLGLVGMAFRSRTKSIKL